MVLKTSKRRSLSLPPSSSSSSFSLLCFFDEMRTLKIHSTRGRRSEKLRSRRSHVPSHARSLDTCCRNGCSDGGKKVMEKLRALKSLLPPPAKQSESENIGGGETEQLFQETADYIVRLRTQVVVLKKLIKIYDNSSDQKKDVVLKCS